MRREKSPEGETPGPEFLSAGSHGADSVDGEKRFTWRCACAQTKAAPTAKSQEGRAVE